MNIFDRVLARAGLRSGLLDPCPACGRPMAHPGLGILLADRAVRWRCETCSDLRNIRIAMPDDSTIDKDRLAAMRR